MTYLEGEGWRAAAATAVGAAIVLAVMLLALTVG
jgi:hypothetical protein